MIMLDTMRARPLFYSLFAAALLLGATSCDETSHPPTADSGTHDQGCDCLEQDTSPAAGTATISGFYWDLKLQKPNVGTNICLCLDGKKTTRCAVTDTSGLYSLDVPTHTPIYLDYERSGWEHAILSLQLTGSLNLGRLVSKTDAEAKTFYAAANVAYPPSSKGNLLINCYPGTKATIAPKSGLGPVYTNTSKKLDPSLTLSEGGKAMFFDLTPGTYTVSCVHPSLVCAAQTGWPSKTGGAKLPVIAGAYSSVVFMCK